MIEKRGELYTCKEHPELNVGRELAWQHLQTFHPQIATLDVMRVPIPAGRKQRRAAAHKERRAARRKGKANG